MLLLTACVSPKSYVDPSFTKATYEDITRRVEPKKWQVVVEFQRNGEHLASVDGHLRDQVERVIRASGMAVPTNEMTAPTLKVVLNNVADVGTAAGKGFGTGLTFGLVGSTVSDFYVMDVTYTVPGKPAKSVSHKHAIHTTIGNANGPAGMTPVTPAEAVNKVIEQTLLNALKDLQNTDGLITSVPGWAHDLIALLD